MRREAARAAILLWGRDFDFPALSGGIAPAGGLAPDFPVQSGTRQRRPFVAKPQS
jgi:hypothetical protein